ncbi:hypothetical protein T492DRAFT_1027365 [Pavlovales sp. CCMP2436]|nr:hypothetical protein T492DRAFT_1027365 [Pavlovales sp. CCMP2436]
MSPRCLNFANDHVRFHFTNDHFRFNFATTMSPRRLNIATTHVRFQFTTTHVASTSPPPSPAMTPAPLPPTPKTLCARLRKPKLSQNGTIRPLTLHRATTRSPRFCKHGPPRHSSAKTKTVPERNDSATHTPPCHYTTTTVLQTRSTQTRAFITKPPFRQKRNTHENQNERMGPTGTHRITHDGAHGKHTRTRQDRIWGTRVSKLSQNVTNHTHTSRPNTFAIEGYII